MNRQKVNIRPRIGVGVIVIKGKQVLLGKRKNAHGEGTWSFPGGHLEFNETPENCAQREIKEETGLSVQNTRRGPYTNDCFQKEKKHYITLYVLADYVSGETKLMEPDKCEKWAWFEWGKLPKPLFLPLQNLLKQKYNPFCENNSS